MSYEFGEFVVAVLIIASAWGLVWASDFNKNVINKGEKDGE